MEVSNSDQREMAYQHIPPKRPKGGLKTMPFIIANEGFERVASYGLLPNMILYLIGDYKLGIAKGTNMLFVWTAATNFTPVVGAFLSDSYLGRFLTIFCGSMFSLLGMILLWLTTMIPQAKPPPCNQLTQICKSATRTQMAILICSFALISIGAGGVRPCSLAFGADQLDKRDNPKNERVLESFFSWYYASTSISVLISLTAIVYIQDHFGWKMGFGVPAILMFFSAFLFLLASPLYVKRRASKSLFTNFAQVLVVAYRNRKLRFPHRNSSDQLYHRGNNSSLVMPTKKLRFLNKACIIRNSAQDIAQDGSASNPWSLCTVEQVEELKALIKVIPLWSSGIMMSINISNGSFPLLQAKSMDRHMIAGFQVPAGSFATFTVITIAIWVAFYDRVLLPIASKISGKRVRLDVKKRMGIGLFVSVMSMVVSANVEKIRRRKAIQEGFLNKANAGKVMKMSAMWLVPQYSLNGLAEALNFIGQQEFYYYEFPRSMSSVASALFGLGMAVANLLASVVLNAVESFSSRGGKQSWIQNDINRGHYDYYYWTLAIMSSINLLYYLVCSWAYGPCVGQGSKVGDEENELSRLRIGINMDEGESFNEEELHSSRELPA